MTSDLEKRRSVRWATEASCWLYYTSPGSKYRRAALKTYSDIKFYLPLPNCQPVRFELTLPGLKIQTSTRIRLLAGSLVRTKVEDTGLEPVTSSMQNLRSSRWANPPCFQIITDTRIRYQDFRFLLTVSLRPNSFWSSLIHLRIALSLTPYFLPKSEWQDLNLRLLGSEPRALARLSYIPN